jgi:hypothetical protein
MKRSSRIKLLVCFWAATILSVVYGFHWRYVQRLRGSAPPRPDLVSISRQTGMPSDLVASLGSFFVAAERRHLPASTAAHPGRIRVIALGDSRTFGDEVVDGLDYPSLLQRQFRVQGIDNVDVINLGNSWYGFGQTVRLWQRFVRELNADFILLGPAGTSPECDSTFNHSESEDPYYLHGRFILDGDGVRFVDVVGGTDHEARFGWYWGFVPRLDVLKYDRHPPAIVRALLPEGRTVENPFYYSRLSPAEEHEQLLERLLSEVAQGEAQVILVHKDPAMAKAASKIGDRIIAVPTWISHDFPNWLQGHFSAAGNRNIARMYHALLTGTPIRVEEVRLSPLESSDSRSLRTLEHLHTLRVDLDETRAGSVVAADSAMPVDFSHLGVRALVRIAPAGTPPLDGIWVGVDTLPPAGAIASLESKGQRIELGRVTPVSETLALYSVPLPANLPRSANADLLIDGRVVAEVAADADRFSGVTPRRGPPIAIRPSAADNLDVARLPKSGSVWIAFDGGRAKVATFSRETVEIPGENRGRHRLIQPSLVDPHQAQVGP